MHVELFSGARAVDADELSQRWARGIVRDVIESLPPDALVIVGDAAGADRIVRSEVMRLGLRGEKYALDGNVYAVTPSREWVTRWTRFDEIAPADASDPRWRSWPLRRNDAMVRSATYERTLGATVHATALLWGESRGTRYTVDVCERAGIVVTRYEPGDSL